MKLMVLLVSVRIWPFVLEKLVHRVRSFSAIQTFRKNVFSSDNCYHGNNNDDITSESLTLIDHRKKLFTVFFFSNPFIFFTKKTPRFNHSNAMTIHFPTPLNGCLLTRERKSPANIRAHMHTSILHESRQRKQHNRVEMATSSRISDKRNLSSSFDERRQVQARIRALQQRTSE